LLLGLSRSAYSRILWLQPQAAFEKRLEAEKEGFKNRRITDEERERFRRQLLTAF